MILESEIGIENNTLHFTLYLAARDTTYSLIRKFFLKPLMREIGTRTKGLER
jgi:hypothetical protein